MGKVRFGAVHEIRFLTAEVLPRGRLRMTFTCKLDPEGKSEVGAATVFGPTDMDRLALASLCRAAGVAIEDDRMVDVEAFVGKTLTGCYVRVLKRGRWEIMHKDSLEALLRERGEPVGEEVEEEDGDEDEGAPE